MSEQEPAQSESDQPLANEDLGLFRQAVKSGDLGTVKRMLQLYPDLLFEEDDYYGDLVRAATDLHPEVADFLARVELQRLREGSVPDAHLYGAIHDLGEAAHVSTGYAGCESLRLEAEPVVAGFLTHAEPQIRYIAVSVLTVHWDLRHYVDALMRMSMNDPDEWVRQIAISGIGVLLQGSQDRDGTRFLIGLFQNSEERSWIRQTAYDGLLEIWRGWEFAHAEYLRRLAYEQELRGAADQAPTEAERGQLEERRARLWEEFVDWDFVARLRREEP